MIPAFWLLLLVPLLIGLVAQRVLRSVFGRYRAVRNRAGATGTQIARALLDAHGLQRVRVEVVPGFLTDNYDGEAKALRLSPEIAREPSVAALGITAHEVSHAYQDAEDDRAYRVRRSVAEPVARFAPWSGLFLIGGFWFGIPILIVLSLGYAVALLVFAIVTLPVEFGASHRALDLVQQTRLADQEEMREIRRVLRAAAVTYVVGVIDRLGWFLALAFLAMGALNFAK